MPTLWRAATEEGVPRVLRADVHPRNVFSTLTYRGAVLTGSCLQLMLRILLRPP